MDINEKMDNAVINENFNTIEKIALNPKNALVRVHEFIMFTGQGRFTKKWVDISEVGKTYFDDLNGDCKDYIMDLPKYKKLDYDKMVEIYDNEVEKTDPYNLKSFNLKPQKA